MLEPNVYFYFIWFRSYSKSYIIKDRALSFFNFSIQLGSLNKFFFGNVPCIRLALTSGKGCVLDESIIDEPQYDSVQTYQTVR